jgi:hypothetical protein
MMVVRCLGRGNVQNFQGLNKVATGKLISVVLNQL